MVKVNDVYGELNRPEGRPSREIRVRELRGAVVVAEVIGRADGVPVTCSCPERTRRIGSHLRACPDWGVGVGRRIHCHVGLLGNANHPLLRPAQ